LVDVSLNYYFYVDCLLGLLNVPGYRLLRVFIVFCYRKILMVILFQLTIESEFEFYRIVINFSTILLLILLNSK
jgi:hypothetical protein